MAPPPGRISTRRRPGLTALVLTTALAASAGCQLFGFIGALEEERRRHSTRSVDAEYLGLDGKDYAVVVLADRAIDADHPAVAPTLTARINERLAEHTAASGWIPSDQLLAYLYEHPRWVAMPYGALADELGVQRLVVIHLSEFRLNDPGNQYLWAGVAAGTVGVVEADSPFRDEFAFQKEIRVRFPDKETFGPAEMPANLVASALVSRFVDRASWLFYKHDEPYYPDY